MSYLPEPAREPYPLAPANWYPDPQHPAQWRWWTGEGWSDHVAPMAAPAQPVAAAAAPAPLESRAERRKVAALVAAPRSTMTPMSMMSPASTASVASSLSAASAASAPAMSAVSAASAHSALSAASAVSAVVPENEPSMPSTASLRPRSAAPAAVAMSADRASASLPATDPLASALRAISVADAYTGAIPVIATATPLATSPDLPRATHATSELPPVQLAAPANPWASHPASDPVAASTDTTSADADADGRVDDSADETAERFLARRYGRDLRRSIDERTSTLGVWALALSPVLVAAGALAALYRVSTAGLDWSAYVIAAAPVVLTLLLAASDASTLRKRGHDPASAAWSLLTPLAYLIARTVRERAGAPLWTSLVTTAATAAAVVVGWPLLPFADRIPLPF